MEEKKLGLIDQIEQGLKYKMREFLEEEPNLLNDPIMGPMRILNYLNNSNLTYKESLIRRKSELDLTLEEINIISKSAYTRVYDELFE